MTLIKKFSAPLIAVAMVAMMAVSLVGQTPRTASAAVVVGEACRAAAGAASTMLGNSTSTGAVTSVNSGSTQTLRIHFDDVNLAKTVRLRVSGGSVNGQAASAQDLFFTTIIAAGQLCAASGLNQTTDGDAPGVTANDVYIQFSFTAPTLPSGIQSQLVQFQIDGGDGAAGGAAAQDGDFGDAADATYFLTVATGASSITVASADNPSISATAANTDAGGATIGVTVRDASGTGINGATIDVVSTAGGLDQSGAAGTCDNGFGANGVDNAGAGDDDITAGNLTQACSVQTDANGFASPTLYGLGAGGTATVTVTVRGTSVSGSTTVIISALPATLEVSGRRTNSATSLVSKTIVERTDSSTTNRDELTVVAVAKDANGNVVANGNVTFTITGPAGNTVLLTNPAVPGAVENITLGGGGFAATACDGSGAGTSGTSCVDAIAAAPAGASTPSHAAAYIDIDSTTGEPLGTYTVTATIPGNNATVTGTTTFTLAKAPATLTIGDIPLIGLGESKAVEITCKDADGNPCAGGTSINVNVSNANLIAQNAATGDTGTTNIAVTTSTTTGIATINLIGVTAGTTNIVANVGTVTTVKLATVGTAPATPPPATGTGTFTGATIAPAGLTIVSFTGTHAQLTTAGQAAKVVSASGTFAGKLLTFVIGAPDFVNVEFVAATPTGLSNTLLIVKTGS